MPRFLPWLLVVLLLAVFATVVAGVLRERSVAGKDLPAYSVYSEGPDGLGEAAHLVRQLGWTPVALTRPVQQTQHRGLLILAEPEANSPFAEEPGGIGEAEAMALLRWVEQGNTLLLGTRKTTALHHLLGVRVTEDATDKDEVFTAVEPGEAGGYTEDIEHLSVQARNTIQPATAGLPLWWVGKFPGAVLLDRGKGRVHVVADPAILTREGLVALDGTPRDDNALFLANLATRDARDGKVYFDEYHHGFRSDGGFWGYLAYHGQLGALLPVLLVLAVAAWAGAVRLGPAVPTPRTRQTDAVDYASALARLYQGTGARRRLARVLVQSFLDTLTRHLRLRRTAVPAVILAAWRQHDPGPSLARLQALFRGIPALRKGAATDRQLLTWARESAAFTRQMHPANGRREPAGKGGLGDARGGSR
jgi:hypothetical protein